MLEQIVNSVRRELESRDRADWERRTFDQLPATAETPRLSQTINNDELGFIFEIKRRSPSAGGITPECDVAKIAREYEASGASGISVLTEYKYFGGSLEDLAAVKNAVSVPLLRKDFVIDKLQIAEAKIHGAGAVLLISAILDDVHLRGYIEYAESIGIDALVEVHNGEDLRRAIGVGARMIGVNNRDLKSMTIDLATGEKLLSAIPSDIIRVAESGIVVRDDVLRMRAAGADAVLIGTSVMKAASMEDKIKELMGK